MAFWNRDPKKKEQKLRNKQLFTAAGEGDLAKVKELVAAGADVNTRKFLSGFSPLHFAAYSGHKAVVEFLLEKGGNKNAVGGGRYNATDVAGWARQGGHGELADFIKNGPKPKPPENPDEITLTRMMGGRFVEEIYDFKGRERTTFVRKNAGGAVEAVTRDSFANIGDKARLREAFNAHVAKGGMVKESEIFPATLDKPRHLAGGQP